METRSSSYKQNRFQMSKPVAVAGNGLQRYQVQQHKALVHSLELECRYCLRGIEQQQRQYRRALSRLSVACSSPSLSSVLGRPRLPCPSVPVECKKHENTLAWGAASLRGTETGRLGRCSFEGTSSWDFDESSVAMVAADVWRWDTDKPSWATLSFADIRHRHRVMIQTQEPFRKWQTFLLDPSDRQALETRQAGPWWSRQEHWCPQARGQSAGRR